MTAQEHYELMEKKYATEIKASVSSVLEYRKESDIPKVVREKVVPTITVLLTDVVSSVNEFATDKTAVLNFASYNNPGGGFIRGMMAQEEALCWGGTLYNVLSRFEGEFYSRNRATKHKGLYTDATLYASHILVGEKWVDVITTAAPNKTLGIRYKNFTNEQNSAALQSRVKFILDVAESHSVDTLFLGAWGCGVFKQNPLEIAALFQIELASGNYGFKEVYFPITNASMCDTFKYVFDR